MHDFRRCILLTDYNAYKSFTASPCKEAGLENLFAPDFPYTLAVSSATSGKEPKIFPKYNSRIPSAFFGDELVAAIFFHGYRELKYVEREPGQIVKKIPVSTATSGMARTMLGWTNVDEDDGRMPVIGGRRTCLLCT